MFAGTTVAVTAGPDFVVEGTIDLVGFGSEDGCEVVGHFRWRSWVEVGRLEWMRMEGDSCSVVGMDGLRVLSSWVCVAIAV